MSDRQCDLAHLVARSTPNITIQSEPTHAEAAASPQGGADSRADVTPRLVIRGETYEESGSAFVDWLSISVPENSLANGPQLIQALSELFGSVDLVGETCDRGCYGYDHSLNIVLEPHITAVNVGKIAWGGDSQKGTTYVSLSGTMCARIRDWPAVASWLGQIGAKIKRVDLAHDDIEGTATIEQVVEIYQAGGFNSGGRTPQCEHRGDWLPTSTTGRTFYVGKRENGKFARMYEKGRQLGNPTSPWLRWEVELHNRDRLIPHQVLLEPARFLAGCYPALQFVSSHPERIPTQRLAAATSLQKMTENLRVAYGKTLNALSLQGLNAGEILSLVVRPGIPKRLAGHVAAMPDGAQYFGSGNGDA